MNRERERQRQTYIHLGGGGGKSQEAKGLTKKKDWVTKMAGLYRERSLGEEQPVS